MTVPPQGPYGAQPVGGGGQQWGGPPPQGPGAQPPYGPPGGPWSQQPQWGAPPPPNKGGKGKWILVGLALVAIIAVSIVGTVLVLRPDSGGSNGQQSNTATGEPEFASANDTGPANIITEEPTCEAWGRISRDLDAAVPDWNNQDYSQPATEWSAEQRAVFEQQSVALTAANEKVHNLAKQTPHRVMRELYGQYIAYSQALIDAVPNYSTTDHFIAAASNKFYSVLTETCKAIQYHAAQESAPIVPPPSPPSDPNRLNLRDSLKAERFLDGGATMCPNWISMSEAFDKDSAAWRALDLRIPATEWTPEQKSVIDGALPIMTAYAADMERLGRTSGNPVWEDFAVLAAQYLRAYIQAVPTYTSNIGYMASQSTYLANAVYWACKAVS